MAMSAGVSGIIAQGASAAVPTPTIPGDFVVDIIPPGVPKPTTTPDCDPDILSIGAQLMTGAASVSAACKFNTSGTQETSTGTVSNPGLAASTGDTGFSNGTLSIVCDFDQKVSVQLDLARTGSSLKTFSGVVFQACTFVMNFTDAKASTLTGTIEVNGKLGSDNGVVTGGAIEISISAEVFVTGGTGQFNGYVGGGTFSQEQNVTIPSAPSAPSAPSIGGGSTTSPTIPSGTTPSPGTGTGVGQSQAQALCAAAGIADCTTAGITAWCGNGSPSPDRAQICQQLLNIATQSVTAQRATVAMVRAMASRVRTFAKESEMKLTLVKKPGAVRILTPAPVAGLAAAPAKVTSTSKVAIAATKGSTCTVRTNTKKVVGKATSKGKALSIKPSKNVYKGAKTIQAFCQSKSGAFTSNKVKIKLS
jgi:hypothetical protein